MCDVSLRRELKKVLRHQPHINFMDFRNEAILFAEDEEDADSKYSFSPDKKESTESTSSVTKESCAKQNTTYNQPVDTITN